MRQKHEHLESIGQTEHEREGKGRKETALGEAKADMWQNKGKTKETQQKGTTHTGENNTEKTKRTKQAGNNRGRKKMRKQEGMAIESLRA